MRSLGGRTVPDGAVGILPAFMMVQQYLELGYQASPENVA